jgi:hypothetical protein
MAYTINRYNGSILTTVQDGTVNTTTEVKLVGKNFAGYGEVQNENFLHLMENFSNPTPPSKPLSGMIWYDSSANKIKFYDGSRWKTSGSAEVNATQPVGTVEGDLWWSSNTNQLFTRSASGEWVLIGPQTTALGTTQYISRTIQGFTPQGVPNEYSIIQAVLSDGVSENTPLVISDADFTINDAIAGNAIDNFNNTVKRGITLSDTDVDGVSTTAIFWGTASNAARLDGLLPSAYVKTTDLNFTNPVSVNGVISFSNDQFDGIIQNLADQTLKFIVRDVNVDELITSINLLGLVPGKNNTYDIGTNSLKWKAVHATNFRGTADVSNQLTVVGVARSASVSATPNTIAARDAQGALFGNFVGNVTGNLTGNVTGNLTGNVTGNITGNAGSVTNGVYTTGDQTIGGTKTFSNAVVLSTAATSATHAVRADRSINTGNGLVGGGNLTADRTISIANEGVGTAQLASAERINLSNVINAIGYTPVQQGGVSGQGNNKLYIGWLGSNLGLRVDNTNFGATWPVNISGNASNGILLTTGSAPYYGIRGWARVQDNVIRGSANMSSWNAATNTINFTTPAPNNNYCAVVNSRGLGASRPGTFSTTGFEVKTYSSNGNEINDARDVNAVWAW